MTRTLSRRGPDDEGYFIDERGGCGLGHRRLSIIDLAGGQQPLSTPDGRVQVIVNGEIYNFESIKKDLQGRGHAFVTNSDCEVVCHGYAEWGEGIIERLDGMFALAIWDANERRLILARDRMGKKPLYYAFVGPGRGTLLFGSELKALVAHPLMDRTVDPSGLASYLTYECLPEDASIYSAANKVLPGTAMVFDRERRTTRSFTFWRMRFVGEDVINTDRWTETQMASALRERIVAATRARLISDVPLGVFLSGGIDSSTVAAAMAQVVPGSDIKTFSITFDDPSFDEGPHARRVAKHLGTDHHEQTLSPRVMLDILPEVADFMCEPLGDASIIPTYLLSRFTRETVTVALGGDGGDELFLGYPTFQADRVARRVDRLLGADAQRMLGEGALKLASMLPVSHKNFSLDFKIKRFAQGLGYAPDLRHQAWMGSFLPEEMQAVLTEDMGARALARSPYATVAGFRDLEVRDPLDALSYQYARLYLTGCVLVKVDRASMAQSLEVRAPLLDTKVVELACALPSRVKMSGMTTKYILKKAVRPWLPNEIIDRPKKGFGIPVGAWLRGPLRNMAYDLLTSSRVRADGIFDIGAIQQRLDEHDQGVADHRKALWTLLSFALWNERYGPGKASMIEPVDVAVPLSEAPQSVVRV